MKFLSLLNAESFGFEYLFNNSEENIDQHKKGRYKVSKAMTMLMMFFSVKSPCGLVGRSQRFGELCCLHGQPWIALFLQPFHIVILSMRISQGKKKSD
jgi:hypothetical protein